MIRNFFLLLISVTAIACGRPSNPSSSLQAIITYTDDVVNPAAQSCMSAESDISRKLACIPGLKVEKEITENVPAGYRRFDVTFSQPVDHNYPHGARFDQRLIVWHKEYSEPMILHTSGYTIFTEQLYLLASRWQTNQIQVTHRFFTGAEPQSAPRDWSKLNVIQSAADFHRIVVAFKQIYPAKWVNNGASKGGMTSVFTRRFYPDDFAGTVADVAPLSFAAEDPRYLAFVDQVGGETLASCRASLRNLQRTLLSRREEFLPLLPVTDTFDHLGGPDVAFEHAVVAMPYAFHQYHNVKSDDPVRCDSIPHGYEQAATIWAWLQSASNPADFSDREFKTFIPYYYQANTELGGSADRTDLFSDILKFPYNSLMYGPKNTPQIHSQDAMRDIEDWVTHKSERIIFVYGENDPWSAAMFPVRTEADSYRFIVPKGNHSAKFNQLDETNRNQFIQTLNRWLEKQMPQNFIGDMTEPLEDPRTPL